VIAAPPAPLAELVGESLIEDGEDTEGKGARMGAERDTYRSGLIEFRSSGSRPRKKPESERLYTAQDMTRAVDDARRGTALETETAVRQAMANDIEQRRCDLLAAIKGQLEQHRSAFEEELAWLAGASQGLAVALAKAVIPRALERQPLIDITDALKVTLARLTTEPSIELRLSADLVEAGEAFLADLAKESGFTGEITTVADPTLGAGDAELRWQGGAVDRRVDRLQAEVLGLVDHWLQEPPDVTDDEALGPCTPSAPEIPDDLSEQTMDTKSANE